MAKKKIEISDDLIPKRPYWANCTEMGCGRGYTAFVESLLLGTVPLAKITLHLEVIRG